MANTSTSRAQTGSYKVRRLLSQGSLYLILGIGAVIAIIPFVFMIQTSFKTYGEHGARRFWPVGLQRLAPYLGGWQPRMLLWTCSPPKAGAMCPGPTTRPWKARSWSMRLPCLLLIRLQLRRVTSRGSDPRYRHHPMMSLSTTTRSI